MGKFKDEHIEEIAAREDDGPQYDETEIKSPPPPIRIIAQQRKGSEE